MRKRYTDFLKQNNNKIFLLFMILVSVLRMGLMSKTPLYAIGAAAYDDQFYVYKSMSIFDGEWLGGYNKTTLIKGVSYALFLALSRFFLYTLFNDVIIIIYSLRIGFAPGAKNTYKKQFCSFYHLYICAL